MLVITERRRGVCPAASEVCGVDGLGGGAEESAGLGCGAKDVVVVGGGGAVEVEGVKVFAQEILPLDFRLPLAGKDSLVRLLLFL